MPKLNLSRSQSDPKERTCSGIYGTLEPSLPPANIDSEVYFEEMNKLNKTLELSELSMGMSSDFLKAAKHLSTYVRVGSSIFGQRS